MSIDYALYERRSGPGPDWLCRPLVDGKERLIFSGATAEAAEATARTWIEKNCVPAKPKSKKPEAADDADIFA